MTICLDTPTKSLTLNLTAVPTAEINFSTHYALKTSSTFLEKNSIGISNGTTNVTLISAPNLNEIISVKEIILYNTNNSTITANINFIDNITQYTLYKINISPNSTWKLSDSLRGEPGLSPTTTVLTQAEYDALGTYDANTFYVVTG